MPMPRFTGLRDLLKYVKDASANAIMRLFTSRKPKYDNLLRRMSSFTTVIQASAQQESTASVTEINVTDGPTGSRKGSSKLGEKTVRFQNGTALQLDVFSTPNRQKLAKDVQMFEEADQYIEELDEMLVRLGKKKDVASRKFVQEMTTYRDNLIKQTEELHDAMDALTRKHLPKEMKTVMSALFKAVNSQLPADSYEDLSQDVYITSHGSLTSKKSEPIEFTYYLHIEGMDASAFKSDELILALTGVVHEVSGRGASKFYMTFHLNAMGRFTPPGAFKIGRQLNGVNTRAIISNLEREAIKQISLYGSLPSLGKRKLKVSQQELRHSGLLEVDGVFDVSVEDDDVVLEIATMDPDVIRDDLWPEVIVYLRKALRAPRKSSFVYKTEKLRNSMILRVSNINSPT